VASATSTSDALAREDILGLLGDPDPGALFERADAVRRACIGEAVVIRGIVEFSNHCARNCLYCGLRRENASLPRYRMSAAEIRQAVEGLIEQGIASVILQSGDDLSYRRETICRVLGELKSAHPGLAVTLSMGERPMDDYRAFRDAGADRYLLKHETASPELYGTLHPGQSFEQRMRILRLLRDLGYQVGAGCIVGLPGQALEHMAADILFLQDFQPDMAGIGPFLPQADTPLANQPAGSVDLTLRMLALARIATRNAHLPATTALASLDPVGGLVEGLRAGCNVIMISGTPDDYRSKYRIYDCRRRVTLDVARKAVAEVGRILSLGRGDSLKTETRLSRSAS
jgi:biotin synthase